MTKPIRILQILGIVAGGGVEAVIMNYYRHIDRTWVPFDFISAQSSSARGDLVRMEAIA